MNSKKRKERDEKERVRNEIRITRNITINK